MEPSSDPGSAPNAGAPGADRAADVADAAERFACPTCAAPAGTPCRTVSGDTAHRYHTGRFILVPELQPLEEVRVPASRGPGRPWPGPASATSASAIHAGTAPTGVARIGYASCIPDEPDLPGQIRALESVGCDRIFFEQADAVVRARPERDAAVDAALGAARAYSAGRVLLSALELRRLARTTRELTALAARLAAGGVGLELLTGLLAGIHHPSDAEPALFAVLAATGELDREHAAARIRAGQRAAEAGGRRSGRPRVFDDELLAEAVRLRDAGVPVPEIAERLIIPAGRQAGRHPSVASVYRALGDAASAGISHAAAHATTAEGSGRPA